MAGGVGALAVVEGVVGVEEVPEVAALAIAAPPPTSAPVTASVVSTGFTLRM